jgi:hypothetical protein
MNKPASFHKKFTYSDAAMNSLSNCKWDLRFKCHSNKMLTDTKGLGSFSILLFVEYISELVDLDMCNTEIMDNRFHILEICIGHVESSTCNLYSRHLQIMILPPKC